MIVLLVQREKNMRRRREAGITGLREMHKRVEVYTVLSMIDGCVIGTTLKRVWTSKQN